MNEKIVIVDDDPGFIDAFTQALRSVRCSVTVSSYPTGSRLLAALETLPPGELPRFVVLDVVMPGPSGIDVLRTLRRSATYKSLPIIILTQSIEPEDIFRAYEYGVNALIKKPDNYRDLKDIVSSVCQFWLQDPQLSLSPDRKQVL